MRFDYIKYSQIPHEDVRYLWFSDFWDGPMSGMALYNGQPYWFEMVEENREYPNGFYRRFGLFEMSPEEIEEETRWHNLFREKVGEHTTYNMEGKEVNAPMKPSEMWKEFYEPYQKRPKPDYLNHPVIGWFEQM
jgi:hypothetical protein